jgi:hypothetical protein
LALGFPTKSSGIRDSRQQGEQPPFDVVATPSSD